MGDKNRAQTSYTDTYVPDRAKLAYGHRIGHFSRYPGKIFVPEQSYTNKGNTGSGGKGIISRGRNMFSRLFSRPAPRKFYMYDRTVVPSIGAGEKINNMFFLPNSSDFRNAYTRKDLINTQTGDSSYFDRLLRHYDSIPRDYLNRVGLGYDRNTAIKYGELKRANKVGTGFWAYSPGAKPPVPFADRSRRSGFYVPDKPSSQNYPYSSTYGVESNTRTALGDAPQAADAGNSIGHELNHESSLPEIKAGTLTLNSRADEITYFLRGAQPRLMSLNREDDHSAFYGPSRAVVLDDPKKFKDLSRIVKTPIKSDEDFRAIAPTLRERLDPYDLKDTETSQAIISFNRNKNLLKNNIKTNRLNYMLRGFNPMHLKMVEMQPDFYTADEAGRKAFINDMNFYVNNPQMSELLGAEGRRGVATYHNLTRESNRNFRVPTGFEYEHEFRDEYDVSSLDNHIGKLQEQRNRDMRDFSAGRMDVKTYRNKMKNYDYIINEYNKQRPAATKGHRQQLFDNYRNDAKKLRDRFIDFRVLGNNNTGNAGNTVVG